MWWGSGTGDPIYPNTLTSCVADRVSEANANANAESSVILYSQGLMERHTSICDVAMRVAYGLAGAGNKLWARYALSSSTVPPGLTRIVSGDRSAGSVRYVGFLPRSGRHTNRLIQYVRTFATLRRGAILCSTSLWADGVRDQCVPGLRWCTVW